MQPKNVGVLAVLVLVSASFAPSLAQRRRGPVGGAAAPVPRFSAPAPHFSAPAPYFSTPRFSRPARRFLPLLSTSQRLRRIPRRHGSPRHSLQRRILLRRMQLLQMASRPTSRRPRRQCGPWARRISRLIPSVRGQRPATRTRWDHYRASFGAATAGEIPRNPLACAQRQDGKSAGWLRNRGAPGRDVCRQKPRGPSDEAVQAIGRHRSRAPIIRCVRLAVSLPMRMAPD
jgi:hypothetical protein